MKERAHCRAFLKSNGQPTLWSGKLLLAPQGFKQQVGRKAWSREIKEARKKERKKDRQQEIKQ